MWGNEAERQRVRRLCIDIAVAFALAFGAALIAELLHVSFGATRLGVLFLAAVVVAGTARGRRAAVIAALVNVAAYRLFLEYGMKADADPLEDLLNAAVFLPIALLTGTLAGRLREEAEASREQARTMERLFDVCRTLLDAADEDHVWQHAVNSVAKLSGSSNVVGVDQFGTVKALVGPTDDEGIEAARAEIAGVDVGNGPATNPLSGERARWRSTALTDSEGSLGAVAWLQSEVGAESAAQAQTPVDIVVQVAAAALARERAALVRIERNSLEAANRLREALLSSISHDFRSPLSAIIGSASSLLEYEERFTREVRHDLLSNILEEGDKLNRYVSNLLNLTRLQTGLLEPAIEPIPIEDVVHAVAERLSRHSHKTIPVQVSGGCAVLVDPLLVEQVLYNVLDNAMKHGDGGAGIEVDCEVADGQCEVWISDHGPGLAIDDRQHAFDGFYLARNGKVAGTGLGLSIVKGFIEAMGGTVEARGRKDDRPGLSVILKLPRAL